jgi:hypothetical protein
MSTEVKPGVGGTTVMVLFSTSIDAQDRFVDAVRPVESTSE